MQFKGRTVIAFVLLAMFASSILTITYMDSPYFAKLKNRAGAETVKDAFKSEPGSNGLTNKDLSKIATTYKLIDEQFLIKVDHDTLVNGAINGMLQALEDPYTVYMDQKEAQQFDETISSSFQGVGAEVSMEDGKVIVIAPIKGSPAEKAGIHANDIIISVNGEKLDGLTLNQAVLKIRGPKGTQAKLEVVRDGVNQPIKLTIVRSEIDVETIYSEMMSNQIGKIEIHKFSSNTAVRFKEELKSLEAAGLKGLIIDVRNDPGGLLKSVVEILNEFVAKDKPIVQVEDRQGVREVTASKGSAKKYPTAVLINKGSASASEILAAAMKESAGSKLFGETTFGKGTVQVTFEKEMGDGSNIKMTTFKWLTPNGNWIHKKGIEPDIAIDMPAYFKAAPLSKQNTLRQDMNGEDVKNLQLMLLGLGIDPGRTDGYFSDKTVSAVISFQKSNSLKATGEVDTETANKLEKAIMTEIKNPKNDLQLKAAIDAIMSEISK